MGMARRIVRDLSFAAEQRRCARAGRDNPLESIADHERYRAALWDEDDSGLAQA